MRLISIFVIRGKGRQKEMHYFLGRKLGLLIKYCCSKITNKEVHLKKIYVFKFYLQISFFRNGVGDEKRKTFFGQGMK